LIHYRIDLALITTQTPQRGKGKYLKNREFNDGLLPSYTFDEHGAVRGINFEMQTIFDDKVSVLKD